jgi:hypothetical protein
MGFMSFNRIKSDCRHLIKKWQTHDLRFAIHWKRNSAKKESFLPQNYINKTISQLVLICRWRQRCHWVLSFLETSTANCWRLKNYCRVVARSRALALKFDTCLRRFARSQNMQTQILEEKAWLKSRKSPPSSCYSRSNPLHPAIAETCSKARRPTD